MVGNNNISKARSNTSEWSSSTQSSQSSRQLNFSIMKSSWTTERILPLAFCLNPSVVFLILSVQVNRWTCGLVGLEISLNFWCISVIFFQCIKSRPWQKHNLWISSMTPVHAHSIAPPTPLSSPSPLCTSPPTVLNRPAQESHLSHSSVFAGFTPNTLYSSPLNPEPFLLHRTHRRAHAADTHLLKTAKYTCF